MNIGPHEIHRGVIWVNEITTPNVAQQITRTILSYVHVRHNPLTRKEMIFEARDGARTRGYFTREQVDYLRNAEHTGATVIIQYRGVSYNAVVKAGGVQLRPKKEIEAVSSDDPYTGTVTFQEI